MNPTTTSTCRSCGGAVLPGDRFCGSCGTPVSTSTTAELMGADTEALSAASFRGSPWKAVEARLQAATIGDFEILTELGRGGMAAVYLARDLTLNRRVAIKVMAPGLLLGPGMVERFRREAVTVANLQHANIVAIHAVRLLDDLHFFVMQFVPGRALEGVLREQGALPLPVVRAWLYQIGSALGYAHRRGVIHRDIKPGNILLNADGEAIVTDFGIAKVAESPGQTQTGTVVGTPVYMSPEQCYAKELTGASDQYSLGVVAYEMLAGRPPFSGSTFSLMRAHTDEPPPRIRQIQANVPPSVEDALLRMLAKRPEERFAHLGEALVALGATPLAPDDRLHATLQDYAGAAERLQLLGDVLKTPASPIPMTRARPRLDTPHVPVPAAPKLVLVVAPPPTDLEPGATVVLRGTVKSGGGQTVSGVDIQWSSNAVDIVSVDATTGTLQALAPGTATVRARAGEASESVKVVVGEPVPAHIAVTVRPTLLKVGDRAVVSALVTSRFGARVARVVEWGTNDPLVAAIDREAFKSVAAATIAAIGPGTADVIATCDGAVGRGSVRILAAVAAAPRTDPAIAPSATKPAASGPPSAPVRQETPAGPVRQKTPPGPVSPQTPEGTVRHETPAGPVRTKTPAPAPATVVIRREDMAAATPPSAPKAQESAAPAPAAPSPPPATVLVPKKRGAIWRFAVPAALAAAVLLYFVFKPSTPSSTTADNTTVPRVDSASGQADTSSVRPDSTARRPEPPTTAAVNPPPAPSSGGPPTVEPPKPRVSAPARVEIRTPVDGTLIPGQTADLAATVRDSAGATMRNARVTWSSANEAVARVDPGGQVRAVAAGATQITARAGNARSTLAVTVVPPPPDPAVVVSIDMGDVRAMTVGETTRLTASALNALGAAATGASIDWSSSDRDVATVSSEGVLTARGAGSAVIRASAGGRSAERSVTVRAPVVRVPPPESTRRADPPPPPPKTEAELRAEVQAVLTSYVAAIQARDTSRIRRVFPTAPDGLLTRLQTMFNDARSAIQMTGAFDILDTPREAAGSQARARYRGKINFPTRGAPVEQPMDFLVTLQRDGGAWRIVNLR